LLDVENYDITVNAANEILRGGERMTIQDFIGEHSADFDIYEVRPDWHGNKIYSVWLKSNEGACVGYPQYAIDNGKTIRLSTIEETIAIMETDIPSADD